jgi:hypothetical protein
MVHVMKRAIHYYLHVSLGKDWVHVHVHHVVATSLINSQNSNFTYSHFGRNFWNQQISSIISEICT